MSRAKKETPAPNHSTIKSEVRGLSSEFGRVTSICVGDPVVSVWYPVPDHLRLFYIPLPPSAPKKKRVKK